MARNPYFSAPVSLIVFYKVALHDSYMVLNCVYCLPQDGPANKVAALMVLVETLR